MQARKGSSEAIAKIFTRSNSHLWPLSCTLQSEKSSFSTRDENRRGKLI